MNTNQQLQLQLQLQLQMKIADAIYMFSDMADGDYRLCKDNSMLADFSNKLIDQVCKCLSAESCALINNDSIYDKLYYKSKTDKTDKTEYQIVQKIHDFKKLYRDGDNAGEYLYYEILGCLSSDIEKYINSKIIYETDLHF